MGSGVGSVKLNLSVNYGKLQQAFEFVICEKFVAICPIVASNNGAGNRYKQAAAIKVSTKHWSKWLFSEVKSLLGNYYAFPDYIVSMRSKSNTINSKSPGQQLINGFSDSHPVSVIQKQPSGTVVAVTIASRREGAQLQMKR